MLSYDICVDMTGTESGPESVKRVLETKEHTYLPQIFSPRHTNHTSTDDSTVMNIRKSHPFISFTHIYVSIRRKR